MRRRSLTKLLRFSLRAGVQLAIALLLLLGTVRATQTNSNNNNNNNRLYLEKDDLELAESAAQQQFASTSSHEILASGWPATSPMWPSMETDGSVAAGAAAVVPFIYADKPSKQDYSLLLSLNKSQIDQLVPMMSSSSKPGPAKVAPLSVSLSFEYYLNHEPQVAGLPGIKIEVDRKEFDYLEPAGVGASTAPSDESAKKSNSIKVRMWTRHSRRIPLADAQHLTKPDWLKLSLVNRESPSLVAIRRLRVEFSSGGSGGGEGGGTGDATPSEPGPPPASKEVAPPPAASEAPPTAAQTQAPPASSDVPAAPPPPAPEGAGPGPGPPSLSPPQQQEPAAAPGDAAGEQFDPQQSPGAVDPSGQDQTQDQVPAASDAISSTIKPVAPKPKGWIQSIVGRRRRRKRQAVVASPDGATSPQVPVPPGNATSASGLVLACNQADACDHWKAEPSAGQIQWSLGRMPPSTGAITRGYFYVSNRLNYGDSSRPLLLWLNQTESATIVDQAADHCVDLALYVTERTRLKLYKAVRHNETLIMEAGGESQVTSWRKTALLVTWAPTTTTTLDAHSTGGSAAAATPSERAHLAGAQLAAQNASGWTLETLCFGDFFERDRKCGLGECALAFEMSSRTSPAGSIGDDDQGPGDTSLSSDVTSVNELEPAPAATGTGETADTPPFSLVAGQPEQVVGVALLRQFAVSVPNRAARPPRWLETWQRAEVEPTDNWRLYPRLDFAVAGDNVTLVNLYTNAHYSLQSDWLQLAGSRLDFGASFLIEVLGWDETLASSNQTDAASGSGQQQQQQSQVQLPTATNDRVFSLRVRRRIVAQENHETVYALNSTIDWYEHYNNATKLALFNMSLPNLSELIPNFQDSAGDSKSPPPPAGWSLFKLVIDIVLECHQTTTTTPPSRQPRFRLMLANVSLADRCHPSPCQFGACQQNGTEPDDWQCACDAQHRGRRCEFGRWCQLAHVAPPTISAQASLALPSSGANYNNINGNSVVANTNNQQQQPQKIKIDDNFQLVILKSPLAASGVPAAGSGAQNKPAALLPLGAQNNNNNKVPESGVLRVTGKEFCQRKLGPGSRCSELDLPLNERLYYDENETFTCSCQDDYYLSDDSKCRQAHQCNSIVCPSIGQICDETKPFNRTQPCHCNEKQDWYPAPVELQHAHQQAASSNGNLNGANQVEKCIRRQCHDKRRDCGFEAHVCLPTVPGEKPICKCGPKFTLKQQQHNDKTTTTTTTGQHKYCQSTACVLPTLNDCQHLCVPNDSDLARPYTCACHEGFTLDKDGRSCRPRSQLVSTNVNSAGKSHSQQQQAPRAPQCKPACNKRTQVCTELGCRCKQGYLPEGEVVVQVSAPPGSRNASSGVINYTQSVRCLNVCSLSYAENKAEFERIESVCPLGLCEPSTFNCRCFDPASSALVHTKYEPIWANETGSQEFGAYLPTSSSSEDSDPSSPEEQPLDDNSAADSQATAAAQLALNKKRASPLCHLKRVCQVNSAGYQLCRARGAICVPDYTKAAMFDCVCPPSSEKRPIGPAGDFQCEPRCSGVRQECLKKQAVCRPIDKDQVRCDCPPGMMLDKHDERCYLAHFSYSMNIIIVNKYYEPESRFHKLAAGPGSSFQNNNNETTTTTVPSSGSESQQQQQLEQQQADRAELANEALHQLVPQFQRQAPPMSRSMFITDYNQCNLTQLLPKAIIEDPYEHDLGTFLSYMDQCNEKIHASARTHNLNSRLAEDLRQSMRQHLREFTITTNNSLCQELKGPEVTTTTTQDFNHHATATAPQISYLNCTVYLQSMEPVELATINHVFTNCDKHGADERFCWVKPRLLLMRRPPGGPPITATAAGGDPSTQQVAGNETGSSNPFQFRQIIACEVNRFCGEDAHSTRLDERTSLCSCRCPADIEMIDLKELEPRARALVPLIPSAPTGGAAASAAATSSPQAAQPPPAHVWLPPGTAARGAIKEICAPRNHCGANSTFCSFKTGSVCQYDIRTGSRCNCVYPSYENNEGFCLEITFSQLDSTLIVVIILVGTCLVVSLAINLYALARSRHGLFGAHKEYPLSEFSSAGGNSPSPGCVGGGGGARNISHRHPDDDEENEEDAAEALSVSNRRHYGNAGNRNHHMSSNLAGMNRSTGMPNMAFDPND